MVTVDGVNEVGDIEAPKEGRETTAFRQSFEDLDVGGVVGVTIEDAVRPPEEGVTQVSLINHEEGVCEADPVEIVGIQVDPVRYVKERGEIVVPLCRQRHGTPTGVYGAWRF
jgi:hypothetical protein